MMNTTGGNGQLPNVPVSTSTAMPQAAAAGGYQVPATGTSPTAAQPSQLVQAVMMDNYANPHQLCEQFWQLKKQYLQQTYGITIE